VRLTPREQVQHLTETMTPEPDARREANAARTAAEEVF